MTTNDYIEKAKALAADLDRDEISIDLASLLATFEHRLKTGTETSAAAHARAAVKLAVAQGIDVPDTGASKKPTKAELRKRVDELGLEVPKSATVAELEAALAAHDQA